MEYIVTIDKFEGPLDLLLHLVKQSNVSIYDINLEEIIKQYFSYIKQMKQLNLNIASSYLVMAAELIEIKSSLLLPKSEIDEDNYELEVKNKLIDKLIEYQNYKDISVKLKELENNRKEYYTKEPMDMNEYEVNNSLPDNINLDDLIRAFSKFLNKQELNKPLDTKITSKEYSVTKRSEEIINIIKNKKRIYFNELFDIKNKSYIIVTFLAILALVKNNELKIVQENNFENILCEVIV